MLLYIQGVMFQTFPILGGAAQVGVVAIANPDTTYYSKSRGNYADYFSRTRGRIYYAQERD